MSLKNLHKAKLTHMSELLNLSVEGTKIQLEERLQEHFDNHPELEEDPVFKKFVAFRKRTSPVKSTQLGDISSSPTKPIPALSEKVTSSPGGILALGKRFTSSFSSPLKKAASADTEESDDDETDDSDVEVLSNEQGADFTAEVEQEVVSFATSAKEWFADQKEKVEDWYYDGADWVSAQNTATKKFLSTAETVNILTTAAEGAVLLKTHVNLIPLKDVSYLDQSILSKYAHYINTDTRVPDLTIVSDLKFVLLVLSWTVLSIIAPVIGSYYFNFIGKKQKKVKFDPLVFNLIKLLLAYFFLTINVSFEDVNANAAIWAEKHGLIETTTFCQKFHAYATHNSIQLRLTLGNLPFVSGFVGALVALYIAAI